MFRCRVLDASARHSSRWSPAGDPYDPGATPRRVEPPAPRRCRGPSRPMRRTRLSRIDRATLTPRSSARKQRPAAKKRGEDRPAPMTWVTAPVDDSRPDVTGSSPGSPPAIARPAPARHARSPTPTPGGGRRIQPPSPNAGSFRTCTTRHGPRRPGARLRVRPRPCRGRGARRHRPRRVQPRPPPRTHTRSYSSAPTAPERPTASPNRAAARSSPSRWRSPPGAGAWCAICPATPPPA